LNNIWTAACPYPEEYKCKQYETLCTSTCPHLTKQGLRTTAAPFVFQMQKKFFKNYKGSIFLNIGNSYVLNEVKNSALCSDLRTEIIPLKTVEPYGETECSLKEYRRKSKEKYIQDFEVGIDNPIILFWSSYDMGNPRKGFDYFFESLSILKEQYEYIQRIHIIFACIPDQKKLKKLDDLGISYRSLGFIKRDEYTQMLSASDVYCCTTLSDAGPRTTYESAAVGTPIISFKNCNAVDFVNDDNGVLIETYDTEGFSQAINKFINLNDNQKTEYSQKIYDTYKDMMDDKVLAQKWNIFLNEMLEKKQ
jgi:glycosyltransferase involved in cell wall biosynthesis